LLTLPALVPHSGRLTGGVSGRGGDKAPLSPCEKIQQRYLPNVELYTHEGEKVRFYDDLIEGKGGSLRYGH